MKALRLPGPRVPGWFPVVAKRLDELAGPKCDLHEVDLLGSRMELDTREYMQRRFYYHCYEAQEVAFVRRWLRPGDRMAVVGAHVGIFTMLGARAVGAAGTVDAFEPVPDTFERPERTVALNRCACVTARNVAVAEAPGTVSLGIPEERLVGYSTSDFTIGASLGAVDATAVALDDLLLEGPRVRLLKLDAEGSEAAVLAGASGLLASSPPEAILREVNHKTLARHGHSTGDGLRTLTAAGYTLHALGRGGRLADAPTPETICEAGRRWDARDEPRSKLRVGWATRHTMFNAVAVHDQVRDS